MNMIKNKKGDVTDIFLFIIIATFLAITFIVTIFVNIQIKDIIENTALNESQAADTIVERFTVINDTTVQNGYVVFISIFLLGILLSAFLVRMHPAFLFLYIIMLAFAIFVSVYLGNLYYDFIQVPEMAAVASNQPMISFFMENIVKITLAVGALSMIIVFSKIFASPGGDDFT